MQFMIRSKYDQRSLLALPAVPGGAVRWVDPIEGIAPWTFPTWEGAEQARNMCADCGEVVPLTQVNNVVNIGCDNVKVSNTPSAGSGAEAIYALFNRIS